MAKAAAEKIVSCDVVETLGKFAIVFVLFLVLIYSCKTVEAERIESIYV